LDATRKVSAIVQGGVSTTDYKIGVIGATQTMETVSLLARKLAPPSSNDTIPMPQPLTLPPELQRKKAAKEKYAPLVMVGLLAGSALVIIGLLAPHKGGLLGFGLLF
jgi:hypothetical protein